MAHNITSERISAAAAMQLVGLSLHGSKSIHLEPIDLEIQAGECVCISGASGCGKSLLLRAIADLDPHDGEVYSAGAPCAGMSGADWRRQVALVPTESAWWAEQVRDHFPRPLNTQQVTQQLEAHGYPPAALDWQVARLSSGERQRLALLRALQGAPRVLLLDEATANLDAGHCARVEQWLMQHRARGLALLWISHDPQQVARVADRYFRIEDGRLQPQAIPT